MSVAALFVQSDGAYSGIPGVDVWDERRDARLYRGPDPVVAHPPCARWGDYWYGSPSSSKRYRLGEDGGCFASALRSVRLFGGVLEHPAGSRAWRTFDIPTPKAAGGWLPVSAMGPGADAPWSWTCWVEQGHYGHAARKPTWLYVVSRHCPEPMIWGPSRVERRPGDSPRRGMAERLSKKQRAATPPNFRDALLRIARASEFDFREFDFHS